MISRITENFTFYEAEKSQTAQRLGIDNTVPEIYWDAVYNVARYILEPCRRFFNIPFSPSSWYRCPELCKAIGSKVTSQHTKGEAVDFEIPGVKNIVLAKYILKNHSFDQLIMEYYKEDNPYSGWIHCSYVSVSNNRKEALIFDGNTYKELHLD